MGQIARRLLPGVAAIILTSSILLLSDLQSRRAPAPGSLRVAVLQHASQKILDEAFSGLVVALRENGFVEGHNLKFQRFNAEGDLGTSSAMASEITGGNYDLAITLTTPSLQSLANANRQGRVRHVFGLVTDPIAASVGIGPNPAEHPPHLTGIGTMQPVAETLRMARQLNPQLKSLGVVWNPAEINSEVNTRLCRKVCQELDITLHEANADTTAAVREAASSLLAIGVDAIWVGGDVTVLAALDSVVGPAHAAHLPVFTSIPGSVEKGTLFDLGANYYEVGHQTGVLAAKVLKGTDPAQLSVELYVPTQFYVNLTAARGLRDRWTIAADLVAKADVVIDETGTHDKRPSAVAAAAAPAAGAVPLNRKLRLKILEYVNLVDVEEAERGVLTGIRDAGLEVGRDFEYDVLNAQGDLAALNSLVDAAVAAQPDLLVTLSTPTLQTALRRAPTVPIVFTFLADAVTAGAGRSDTDHRPNVTGSYASGDVEGIVRLIPQVLPRARRVGVLYSPNEVNSVYNTDQLIAALTRANFSIEKVGVNTASEVADAALALCGKSIDLICLPTANLTASTFPSVVQAAQRARLPIFGFLGGLADQGATLCLARDYFDMGREAGRLAGRVLRGESPAGIPFHPGRQSKLTLNPEAARLCGFDFSPELLKTADRIVGQ